MDSAALRALTAQGESLTVEFKGEERARLNDRELVEAVVCLANAEGGMLLIGVEDDGRITGAHARHGRGTDAARLQSLVRSRTVPSVEVGVEAVAISGVEVLCLSVPRAGAVVASSDGTCLRRAMGPNGPECAPFYPYQHAGRRTGLGAEDFSAHLLREAGWRALDPLQFERARCSVASSAKASCAGTASNDGATTKPAVYERAMNAYELPDLRQVTVSVGNYVIGSTVRMPFMTCYARRIPGVGFGKVVPPSATCSTA